jgi:hypothetical protein
VSPVTRVRLDLDVETDANGTAEICAPPGSLPSGHPTLYFQNPRETRDLAKMELDIRPFGYSLGRERTVGAPPSAVPPSLTMPDEPLLQPSPDTWYAFQVTTPSLVGDLLAFSGSPTYEAADHNPYHIGMGHLLDGTVQQISAAPVLPVSDWDAGAQHDPDLHWENDQYVLYYQGRKTPSSIPAIGRAFSEDGEKWEVDPNNPVYANVEAEGASHPSVIYADDGFVELWHGGLGGIGFALSTDGGQHFTADCNNPVLDVRGMGLKTPQVQWKDGVYRMSFAIGQEEAWHLGWAESYDGETWMQGGDLLVPGIDSWNNLDVSNASFVETAEGTGFLFGAVGTDSSGLAFTPG